MYGADRFMRQPLLFDAAARVLETWSTELQHEEESGYRFAELSRGGLGPPVNYTGTQHVAVCEVVLNLRLSCCAGYTACHGDGAASRHVVEWLSPQRRSEHVRVQRAGQHVRRGVAGTRVAAQCSHLAR